MPNIIFVKTSSPPSLLCTLVRSFITVVDQVFINEGTSVSLKQKDAWRERERDGGGLKTHMLRASTREGQGVGVWLQGV